MDIADAKESIAELSTIFSTANLEVDAEEAENFTIDEENVELNIGKLASWYHLASCSCINV